MIQLQNNYDTQVRARNQPQRPPPHHLTTSLLTPAPRTLPDDTQVFNGDIGHVSSVWQDGRALRFSVRFGIGSGRLRETTVEYTRTALDRDIALSYALTIHKAQGGEYPVVVMPVVPQHRNMLYRNLLYTGLSRAKQLLVMVGSESAVQHAVNNDVAARRVTLLAERVDSREFAPAVTRHMQE